MTATSVSNYKDLVAWQKAMDLVEMVYRLTRSFPPEERFGLVVQTRRAAVSIPCNIAEGFGRAGKADFVRFLDISVGSANEVETQLLVAVRLGIVTDSQAGPACRLALEVQRVLKGLIRSLRGTAANGLSSRGRKQPPPERKEGG